jgi:hypothetical protein
LKVSNLSKLTVIELADQYKKTTIYGAAEFYAPEDEWMGYPLGLCNMHQRPLAATAPIGKRRAIQQNSAGVHIEH